LQHTLLAVGFALIAAIVAALAAPLFVDWNAWRAEFEKRATVLVNAPVSIKGPINATILPLPAFTLRDVTIGDAQTTSLDAGQIRGVLSLGALLRGRLEAEEVAFTKPELRVVYGADGKVVLPAGGQGGLENFSVSRISFDAGAIVIRRPAGNEIKLEDVSGFGALQSRAGPFKFEFAYKAGEENFAVRTSTGEFRDGAAKARLLLTRIKDGAALDADGNLTLAEARPRFEGKIGLLRRAEGVLPWKLSASAQADVHVVALDQIELALGGSENAIEFTGNARIEPEAGKFVASIAAKSADLDRFGGGNAKQDLISASAPLREALAQLSALSFTGSLAVTIDNLVAGGAVVRDLKGALLLREGRFAPQRFEARLPGLASVNFVARSEGRDEVTGGLSLTAEEPAVLARWIGLDRLGFSFDDGAPLRLDGDMHAFANGIALAPFTLTFADTKLSGSAAYRAEEADKAARLEAKLVAEKPDLALFFPLVPRAADFGGIDVAASLDARSPKLLGGTARRFDTAFTLAAGALSIERLSLEDFGGFNLRAHGELAAWRDRPNGRIDVETEAVKTDAFVSFVQNYAGTNEAAALIRRITAAAIPLRMTGILAGDGASPEVAVEINGSISDAQATLVARLDPRAAKLGEARIVADAPDAARLVALLGLPMPEPHAGQGHLEAMIGRPKQDVYPLKANLTFPGINLAGEGDLRAGREGRIEPRVDLRLQATDVRALLLAAARTANAVVPATGTVRLVRTDDAFAFEDIVLDLNDIHVRGRLVLNGVEQPVVTGKLAMNRAELPILLAFGLGRASDGGPSPWSDKPLGPAALESASGAVDIESTALILTGPFVATGARLKLRFAGNEAAIEGLSGELAGGKLSGQVKIVHAKPLFIDGSFSLAAGDIARLVAPGIARADMRGRTSLALQFTAQGDTPAAIAASVTGQGNLALEGFEIDKLDPEALLKVAPAPNAPPLTETEAAGLLAFGLQKAPLRITKLETPIIVTSGVARTGKPRTVLGPIEVTSGASLDLAKLELDAAVVYEAAASEAGAPRPAATIRWRGPLADPKRSIDASAVVAALSLQTIDAEMRKLEGRPATAPARGSLNTVPATAPMPMPKRRPPEAPPPTAAELPQLPQR